MPNKLDWAKARTKTRIWKKGGLPKWQDGWNPEPRNASSGDLESDRKIETRTEEAIFFADCKGIYNSNCETIFGIEFPNAYQARKKIIWFFGVVTPEPSDIGFIESAFQTASPPPTFKSATKINVILKRIEATIGPYFYVSPTGYQEDDNKLSVFYIIKRNHNTWTKK